MSTEKLTIPEKSPKIGTSKKDDPIRELTKKRGIIRGRLTVFTKYIGGLNALEIASNSNKRAELQLRIDGASVFFNEFSTIQTEIEVLVDDQELFQQLELREGFESSYYAIIAQAKSLLSSEQVLSSNSTKLHAVKLPTIPMPTFDGSYEHWLEFRDTFKSLVHNSKDITPIQKYHYLKSALKGVAALVIDSLEFSSNNYTVAWDLICNRYNNTRLLVHNHVKALFSINNLVKESPSHLRKLIDTILKNLRALKLLHEPVDSWDTLIIYMVVSKLDSTTEREWEQFRGTITTDKGGDDSDSSISVIKVDHLITFLRNKADMLETLLVTHSGSKEPKQVPISKVHCHASPSSLNTHNSQHKHTKHSRACFACNSSHPIYTCQTFSKLSLQDKLKCIQSNNLCPNCLRSGHSLSQCRFGSCRKCNERHNTLIHNDQLVGAAASLSIDPNNKAIPVGSSSSEKGVDHCTYAHNAHLDNQLQCAKSSSVHTVILSTALVEVADQNGKHHVVRALLDCGSERCFITQQLCDTLNKPIIQSTAQIKGVGNSITHSLQSCDIEIKALTGPFVTHLQCLVLANITSSLPQITIQSNTIQLPNNIQLADPIFYESQQIDILIGADKFWYLLGEGRMRLRNGPFLQNTKLGWIISGPIYTNNLKGENIIHCNFTQSIEAQLKMFWELEELPKPNLLSDDEKACDKHFIENTKRTSEGRFCVQIPFKQSPDTLGSTYTLAERRFLALEKRLQQSPSYKKLYTDFINEYIRLGHMSKVDTFGKPHFFMPHHGVFREHSTTTKLRVVFNASQKSSSDVSLNDLQLVGPPIQGDLMAILLRFRQHKFVVCADIEKAYRQVLVDEQQRDLQMILWRENPSERIGYYRLNTVTYGTASAPFLTCRCIKQLAAECSDPEVQQIINEDFYVDDFIYSNDSKNHLLEICDKIKNVLDSGCFPLRKWVYNFNLDNDINIKTKDLSLGDNVNCRTLGLGWDNFSDNLYYHTQSRKNTKDITKRVILSSVSQIFDPLGLLGPTIMIGKMLLQKLWLLKLGWDEPVPSDVANEWNRFETALSILNSLRVPRHVMGTCPRYIELHLFSDASQLGYGACAYIRTINTNDTITVRLLCSKGKVAPIKPLSIPRLELCGALLSAKLFKNIKESLRYNFHNVVFWTDSTIVLGWLRMAPSSLKTFVQNRTVEISELTKDYPWRHVSGKDNPSDLVSRGLALDSLSTSRLWWDGPEFLHEMHIECIGTHYAANNVMQEQDLPELKSLSKMTHAHVTNIKKQFKFPFERFSQFNRLVRGVARLKRVLYNKGHINNPRTGPLSVDEVRESLNVLIRFAQSDSFSDIYKSLNKNQALQKQHNLSNLNLFIDDNQIIRVGGRLENSTDFNYDKKHPILISSKHHFTILIFRHEHSKQLHAAPQLLLFTLRDNWWPIGGRSLARKIVHDCVLCARLRGKTTEPIMGNLPKERLSPGYPFMYCGVDYAGPVLILNKKGRGAKTSKAYICLFVCFTTRAIHLELVSDLTTDAYFLALKRFISRRSKPSEIFSDNGKCFVGLKNEFSSFLSSCSNDIIDYATSQGIKFTFIPPYAPHFGGLWEAGVKSCKYHLRRVVGNAHLTFEEFSTALAQIEAILNSRPLTPLSPDPQDLLPLSPAHFLVGRSLNAPICANLENKPTHSLSRYQRVEQIRQHFWSRWSKEYVSELQTRTKWKSNTSDLKVDTLVVIKDSNTPPLKWNLGRIIAVFPGPDGISRVADIRTASGVVKRAFSKICPLPVPVDGDTQEPALH